MRVKFSAQLAQTTVGPRAESAAHESGRVSRRRMFKRPLSGLAGHRRHCSRSTWTNIEHPHRHVLANRHTQLEVLLLIVMMILLRNLPCNERTAQARPAARWGQTRHCLTDVYPSSKLPRLLSKPGVLPSTVGFRAGVLLHLPSYRRHSLPPGRAHVRCVGALHQ